MAETDDEESSTIHLLHLAAAAVAASISAAEPIRAYASSSNHGARLKDDGSVVTDADFEAQGRIVRTLLHFVPSVTIVGEESPEEMELHMGKNDNDDDESCEQMFRLAQRELNLRVRQSDDSLLQTELQQLPLAPSPSAACSDESPQLDTTSGKFQDEGDINEAYTISSSRVRVFVDPLDGTNSYSKGDFDAVTILIAIIVDNIPKFGVICKPFRYSIYSTVLDTECVVLYGGPLIAGVYLAGVPEPCQRFTPNEDSLPRAVISSSRSKGVVADFCQFLADKGLIDSEPLSVSGAGEKSLRLLLGTSQESLWFFPRGGTSRWDVAASDALLRAFGGRLTDKFGEELDYTTVSRDTSENLEGIIASNSTELHAECVRLFAEYRVDHDG